MIQKKYLLVTLFLCIMMSMFLSCRENEIEQVDDSVFGYEYYPLDIGHTWVYQVDSVLIGQGGNQNVISSSFIMESITQLISEDMDEKRFRLERSFRKDDSLPWTLTDVWTTTRSNSSITKTVENVKFVKFVFPAKEGVKWDGNVFFNSDKLFPVAQDNLTIYKDWSYKVNTRGGQRDVDGVVYPDVIEISHIDEETFISRRLSYEFYSRDVGMIERYMEIFDTQNRIDSEPWVESAEKGFMLHEKLISFTKN